MYHLPLWVVPNSRPGFYDAESATIIEQTAKVYKAMQDLITEYNSFANTVNTKIDDFMNGTAKDYEVFTTELRQEFQDFIDTIELKFQSQDKEISDAISLIGDNYNSFTISIQKSFKNHTAEVEQKLTLQDNVISNAVDYMKKGLRASVYALLVEMRNNGELTDAIYEAFDNINETVENLKTTHNTDMQNKIIYVTPEMYGAKGDGITDDSDAIIQALNSGKVVVFKNTTYAVSKELQGTAEQIQGSNSTIKLLNDVNKILVLPNAAIIRGFVFDCSNHGVTQCISTNSKIVEISHIEIYNVNDLRTDLGSELICCSNNENVTIHNIYVHDCTHIINGVITDSAGNITCIYVHNHTQKCLIEDISIKNIHNVNSSGEYKMEDGGGIYIRCTNKNASTFIRNVYGYNYCKRLIKLQCLNTVLIDNVYSYSNTADHLLSIGVGSTESDIQTEYGNAIISNSVLINDWESTNQTQYLISTSEKVTISNCKFISKTQMSILNTGDMNISNCVFEGNGIQYEGRTLEVDRVYFEGQCFLASSQNYENIEYTKIENSNLRFKQLNGVNYSQFELKGGRFFLYNNILDNLQVVAETTGTIHKLIINNSSIVDRIVINNTNVEIKDIEISSADGLSLVRAINVNENSTATFKDVNTNGFSYSITGHGNVYIKGGVDISLIYGSNFANFENVPEYVNELPIKTTTPNGTILLLKTDNKMYKYENSEWAVVQ